MSTEYAQRLITARTDVYRQMGDTRRAAMDRRTARLGDTQATVEQALSDAATRVRLWTVDADATLDREADDLASAIVIRVLGRAS